MFKARMRFAKEGRAKYISHLDLMHTLQRAMARCQMPLWFTEGYNQHAYVSVALPLATGFSGECEFLDFNLLSDQTPPDAVARLNAVLPEGLRALEIYPLADGGHKIADIAWSRFRITWGFADCVPDGFVEQVQSLFARDEIPILKRSKRGEKVVNLREFLHELPQIQAFGHFVLCETVAAAGNQSLSPEYLTRAVQQYLPQFSIQDAAYHRLAVYTAQMEPFR